MLRRTLCSALGAILAAGMPAPDPARSQAAYPDHPVTLVVPAAAGGRGDIVAHLLAERLSGGLGQRVIVENKAGASGNIGNAGVARAPLDGYTLLHAYSDNHSYEPGPVRQARLGPARLRAGSAHREGAPRRRQAGPAGRQPCRARRLRQGEPGQAHLHVLRPRLDPAYQGRGAAADHERCDGPCCGSGRTTDADQHIKWLICLTPAG